MDELDETLPRDIRSFVRGPNGRSELRTHFPRPAAQLSTTVSVVVPQNGDRHDSTVGGVVEELLPRHAAGVEMPAGPPVVQDQISLIVNWLGLVK
jgi:hypothetical protein